jgi:hypothetical protein
MPKPAHILIPASANLPALGSTDGQGDDVLARIKLFTPDSSWTWYLTEYDADDDVAFGLVNGHEEELGYVSIAELRAARGPLGLRVERDIYWTPKPLKECRRHASTVKA